MSTPSTVKDSLVGSTLQEYRVDELFSVGGMNRLYKGVRVADGTEVAIRVLHAYKRADKNALKRFEHAAKAASKLSHPALIPILSSGYTDDGLPFIACEFVRGRNVRDELAETKIIPPAKVRQVMLCAASALQHAHEAGVIHRNLKPGNIIVRDDDPDKADAVVTGFGIARLISSASASAIIALTSTKKVVGSPAYMSPEQFSSKELDARSDVYSFGCVMYEMLTGTPPYLSNSFLGTGAKHSYEYPVPIRDTVKDVPPYLESVVVACMQKEPAARYQSMQDLASDLQSQNCRFGNKVFPANKPAGKTATNTLGTTALKAIFIAIVLAVCGYTAFTFMAQKPQDVPSYLESR